MQRWLIAIAVAAGLAVVAAGLAIRAQPGGAPTAAAERIALHPERKPKLAGEARESASPLLPGEDLGPRLRSLRGRPVVLNAWASWCPPCREELPLLAAAATRFGDRAAFLGADVEDDAGAARALLAEIPLGYPSYSTSIEALADLAPAAGTPFTVFLDRRGEVVGRRIGAYRSAEELDAEVERLLNRQPSSRSAS
jgi:thiol-disulfide isomerase/thioredoxin